MSEENFECKWLEEPFSQELLRNNPHKSYRCTYVEARHIVERLNRAFDYRWSLEVIREEIVKKTVKTGRGKDARLIDGAPFFVVLVRLSVPCLGIVKEQYGAAIMVNADPEDCRKAAVADAMKKCASLLGIGLHIAGPPEQPPEQPHLRLEDMPIAAQWSRMYILAGFPTGDEKTEAQKTKFMKYIGTLSTKYFGVPCHKISGQQADELIKKLEKAKNGRAR